MEKRGFWDNVFNAEWKGLLKVAIFIIVVGILSLLGTYSLIKKLGGIDSLESTKEGNIKIHFGGFGSGGEDWTIIDVPAGVFGVPSGVKLEKDKEIEITASGAVLTDAAAYFKNSSGMTKSDDLLDKYNSRIIGWRRPDGSRVNFMDKAMETEITTARRETKQAAASDKLKLMKDEEYGCLLGLVFLEAREDFMKNVDDLIKDNKAIVFRIGQKAVIKSNDGRFVVDSYDENRPIKQITLDKGYIGRSIYLLVNDCVVKNEQDIDNVISDKKERIIQKEIYRSLRNCQKANGKAIWYGDNMGHFQVLIKNMRTSIAGILH